MADDTTARAPGHAPAKGRRFSGTAEEGDVRWRQGHRERHLPSPKIRLRPSVRISICLACAASLFLASLCGCSSSTPQGAVREFLDACMRGDRERAAARTVEHDLSGYLGGEEFFASPEFTFRVELTEMGEDRAVVTVRFSREEEEVAVPYVCRYVGGRWMVALRETERLWWPDIESLGEGTGGTVDH